MCGSLAMQVIVRICRIIRSMWLLCQEELRTHIQRECVFLHSIRFHKIFHIKMRL